MIQTTGLPSTNGIASDNLREVNPFLLYVYSHTYENLSNVEKPNYFYYLVSLHFYLCIYGQSVKQI